MVIIAVGANASEQSALVTSLKKICADATVVGFYDPLMAFKYAVQNSADYLFTDCQMNRLSGNELAAYIKRFNRNVKVCLLYNGREQSPTAENPQFFYLEKPLKSEELADIINVMEKQ